MEQDENRTGSEKPGQQSALALTDDVVIVVPNVGRAKEAMQAFERLKSELLEDKDKAEIKGKETITRSGFSKIAIAFGVSTNIEKITRLKVEGNYIVHVVARATAPNGRYAEANASCDTAEFKNTADATVHNIESKAGTRATSRAIANLVGGSILSAEEFRDEDGKPAQSEPASEKQLAYLRSLASRKNVPIQQLCVEKYHCQITELNKDQASEMIDVLNKMQ